MSSTLNAEGWIVLAVGIATVGSQVVAALLGRGVASQQAAAAERQAEAAQAALRTELAAVLVITRGGYSTEQGAVRIHNGGRHAAIDVRLRCEDENGDEIWSARTALVAPSTDQEVSVALGSVEKREAFGNCGAVIVQ